MQTKQQRTAEAWARHDPFKRVSPELIRAIEQQQPKPKPRASARKPPKRKRVKSLDMVPEALW